MNKNCLVNILTKKNNYPIILIILFIVTCMTIPTCGQNYGFFNFENGGDSCCSNDCFGGHEWILDTTQGYNSNFSMKSTNLGMETDTLGLGVSSLCKNVTGPAYVSFFWKSETEPIGYGDLSFFVDDNRKPFISSPHWTNQIYHLPNNKTYKIEWRYYQKNPGLKNGTGWMDNLLISNSPPSHEAGLNCIIDAPNFVGEGSTCIASVPSRENVNYSWEIIGGKILGDPNEEIINWEAGSVGEVTLILRANEKNLYSVICSKNITITPKKWPYLNLSIHDLCDLVILPKKNVTYVGKENDPLNSTYFNITDAINNVTCGGTVVINKGVYEEEIIINKPINLIGADRNNTIIIGNGHVIYIVSDDVKIQNLTVQGGVYGLQVFGDNCSLSCINIYNSSFYGAYFFKSNDSSVQDCNFKDIGVNGLYGMCIYSYMLKNNVVINSSFANTSIGIEYWDASNSLINNNTFDSLTQGIKILNESSNNNVTCQNRFEKIPLEKRLVDKSQLKNQICNLK